MTELQEINYKRKIIPISFFIAIILTIIPLDYNYFFWVPEWIPLVLFFWLINTRDKVGILIAFFLGLFLDVFNNVPLGSYGLSFSVCSFIILLNQRMINNINYGFQSLIVLILLLINKLIIVTILTFFASDYFSSLDFRYFTSLFTTTLLWPIFNKFMLKYAHRK